MSRTALAEGSPALIIRSYGYQLSRIWPAYQFAGAKNPHVKLDSPPTAATAAHIEVTVRNYWKEKPVPDDIFKAYVRPYA